MQEVIAKFPDIDGVELDGMRSPFFFKAGTQRKNAPLMTELIRQIRGDLDQAAKARGRERYLLRVNVPRTPEAALEVGMDVAAWDAERLVDGISPGCYNTDFQPAVRTVEGAGRRPHVDPLVHQLRPGDGHVPLVGAVPGGRGQRLRRRRGRRLPVQFPLPR